jgi:hypothetical protein
MHGGALGTGAPRNNTNAVKHGFYRRQTIFQRRKEKEILLQVAKLLHEPE